MHSGTGNKSTVHITPAFCTVLSLKSAINIKWCGCSIYSYNSSLSKGLPPSPDSSKRRRITGGGSSGRRSTFAYLARLSRQWKHTSRRGTPTFDQILLFGVLGVRNVWCVQQTGRTQRTPGRQWLGAPVHDSAQNWDQPSGADGDSLSNPWESILELRRFGWKLIGGKEVPIMLRGCGKTQSACEEEI